MEVPHDVVTEILVRIPAKSLVRFKCVSKQWKNTIASENFQKRQLIHQQSRDRDVLFLKFHLGVNHDDQDEDDHTENISSSLIIPVKLPIIEHYFSSTSCDGLLCLYKYKTIMVINPATRWHRKLPLSNFDQISLPYLLYSSLGFGKDKINGTYKLVYLYNTRECSSPANKATTTTCEIFDFNTNSWRYVTPSSIYEIIPSVASVYVDGSVHWLTNCEKIKVLSLDLHTETFQVIAELPFVYKHPPNIHMSNLNNRLCIYENGWPNQVIWLVDSGSKTLSAMYSIDLMSTCHLLLEPIAVLKDKNNKTTKLLFSECLARQDLVTYDLQTKSYDFFFTSKSVGFAFSYVQSLISI